jgi:hypothetical protein
MRLKKRHVDISYKKAAFCPEKILKDTGLKFSKTELYLIIFFLLND